MFTITKRAGEVKNWEPVYIGTDDEPIFDERLSWEGKLNKLVQVGEHIILLLLCGILLLHVQLEHCFKYI